MGVRPSSSSLSSATTRHTDAASFWLLALPAETVPSRITGRKRAEGLHVGVGARAFVFLKRHRVAAALRHRHAHYLFVEAALTLGGDGALVAAEGVLVLLGAGDFVLAGQVLGGLHHATGDGAEALVRGDSDAGAGQTVVEGYRAEAGAPAGLVAVELRAAHALDAAGDDNVRVICLHQHAGVQDGLQARGAAAVQLVAGHLDGQSGLEPRQAANGGVLTAGIAVAEDDVVDLGRVDARAVEGLLDNRAGQIGG